MRRLATAALRFTGPNAKGELDWPSSPMRSTRPPGMESQMKKRMSKRPSMTSTAAIAIALIALIATFGGAAVAGKGKKK